MVNSTSAWLTTLALKWTTGRWPVRTAKIIQTAVITMLPMNRIAPRMCIKMCHWREKNGNGNEINTATATRIIPSARVERGRVLIDPPGLPGASHERKPQYSIIKKCFVIFIRENHAAAMSRNQRMRALDVASGNLLHCPGRVEEGNAPCPSHTF